MGEEKGESFWVCECVCVFEYDVWVEIKTKGLVLELRIDFLRGKRVWEKRYWVGLEGKWGNLNLINGFKFFKEVMF